MIVVVVVVLVVIIVVIVTQNIVNKILNYNYVTEFNIYKMLRTYMFIEVTLVNNGHFSGSFFLMR